MRIRVVTGQDLIYDRGTKTRKKLMERIVFSVTRCPGGERARDAIMNAGVLIDLRYLRNSEREAILPGCTRAHLSAVLRRTTRGDARLPERLPLSRAGARAR